MLSLLGNSYINMSETGFGSWKKWSETGFGSTRIFEKWQQQF